MLLTADAATNFNIMHSCIPLQIKKSTNTANNIDDDLMTVNDFLAHFIKEIDIRRYSDDIRILPTNNTVDIYKYSDAMLKHMPDDALKTYDETLLLYSKKAVKLVNNVDRPPNNTDNSRTDDNLDDRIDKFHDLLGKKKICRIPLRLLIYLGLVNFPISFDTRYTFTLERDLNRLFESKKKVNTIPGPDTKIIILEMPFISYPVIQLNGHFELYFNSVLRLKKPKEQG